MTATKHTVSTQKGRRVLGSEMQCQVSVRTCDREKAESLHHFVYYEFLSKNGNLVRQCANNQ